LDFVNATKFLIISQAKVNVYGEVYEDAYGSPPTMLVFFKLFYNYKLFRLCKSEFLCIYKDYVL